MSEQPEPEFLQPYTITGHEASAYLTYLVQHYHDLHPYTIFVHGSDGDSNSDIGEQRILDQLPDLRFQAVDHSGFVSLHCPSFQNCPINPTFSNTQETNVGSQDLVDDFPQIWSEIFALDSSTAPIQLGNQGSSQFMVTKERIQQEPPAYYSRILHWVATTGWSDSDGIASLMEQLWHIIFGMPAEK